MRSITRSVYAQDPRAEGSFYQLAGRVISTGTDRLCRGRVLRRDQL